MAFAVRRPWTVLCLSVLLAVAGMWLSLTRFAINTDTAKLIAPEIEWRRMELAYDRAFPDHTELLVVVIDAPSPERADEAADALVAELQRHPETFRSARRPDGGPFFERNGLLFLDTDELRRELGALAQRREVLAPLASDPSLRGLAGFLEANAGAIRFGAATPADLAPAFDRIGASIDAALAGRPARLSWRTLMSDGGTPGAESGTRRLVLARPVLDYSELTPGSAATDLLRARLPDLGLTAANGIRVRITGPVALADEEFATVAENMGLNATLTIAAVAVILFLALRSAKLIVAVLITLFAGLVVTCGLGLLAVGRLNLISVAFFALFIGLGVDFGIQFAVRYRAERHATGETGAALRAAARGVGFSLTLAALSLIAGFLSFLPTDFRGVSELGLIAGLGMFVAYAASFTLLPALIMLLDPPPERKPVETRGLAALDHWIAAHRKLVLGGTALVILAGVPALSKLRFDSNPMNLRSRQVESVSTYFDLARDPNTSPNAVEVLAPSLDAVPALAARLAALPEVARVVSLLTLVPDGQEEKRAIIAAAAAELAPVLHPDRVAAPTDAEQVAALREAAVALRELEAPGAEAAKRLAGALERLAGASPPSREAAGRATTMDFSRLVEGLRRATAPDQVTRATLPRDIVEEWMAADGRARIEVFAREDLENPAANERFVAAVRAVSSETTGAPVTVAESGRTIIRSFVQAGLYSLIAITLILWIAMRRLLDVVLALGPLVLAGIMTLEAAHLVGLELNFANIIALPLMFGVGVAFHIYYLIAWRAGVVDVLASSLTRAIFFSALTTGVAFGSLWASSHPGTASMGELLAISLVFTLLAAFIIVPAFLGPPRTPAQPGGRAEPETASASRDPVATSAASSSA